MTLPISFQSEESKTNKGLPVYNEILWKPSLGQETWTMRQSHHGAGLDKNKWDKLAIVVDTTENTVRFYQQEKGQLEWRENDQEVPFSVSCFNCHSNGPRAIRPEPHSTLSFKENIQINLLNARIHTYGVLKAKNSPANQKGDVPFRSLRKFANETLTIHSCSRCHSDEGLFHRGFLTRQNSETIKFMIDKKHMPLHGELSSKDKKYLSEFINFI